MEENNNTNFENEDQTTCGCDLDPDSVSGAAILKLGALAAAGVLAVKGGYDLVKERIEAHKEKKAAQPQKEKKHLFRKKTGKKAEEPAKDET